MLKHACTWEDKRTDFLGIGGARRERTADPQHCQCESYCVSSGVELLEIITSTAVISGVSFQLRPALQGFINHLRLRPRFESRIAGLIGAILEVTALSPERGPGQRANQLLERRIESFTANKKLAITIPAIMIAMLSIIAFKWAPIPGMTSSEFATTGIATAAKV
jgi:hypothetical protein